MSEYPFGPHGPRIQGPPQVTPNPTSSWVEPTSSASDTSYAQGGGSGQPGGVNAGSFLLHWLFSGRKRLWLAIAMAWFFGPLGLLYAIGDSKPQLVALAGYVGGAFVVHYSRFVPPVHLFHPILMTCAIWSVFAALAYNRRHNL